MNSIPYDEFLVKECLDNLVIPYKHTSDNRGWLHCLCPFHNDTKLGSGTAVNTKLGIFKCYTCGTYSIPKLFMKLNKITYKEALIQIVGKDGASRILKNLGFKESKRKNKIANRKSSMVGEFRIPTYQPIHDISKYKYMLDRGYSKEFLDFTDAGICNSGYYKDYLITPIFSNSFGVNLFEARKIKECEIFPKVLKKRGKTLKEYRNIFKKYERDNLLSFSKDEQNNLLVIKNGEIIEDSEDLAYLMKPKTLYPKNSWIIKHIIYNESKLDKSKPLYLCESLSKLPKIYNVFGQNVSVLFGAKNDTNFSARIIDLLNSFPKVVYIPDPDDAGMIALEFLNSNLINCETIYIELDDSENEYENLLKISEPKKAGLFLLDFLYRKNKEDVSKIKLRKIFKKKGK